VLADDDFTTIVTAVKHGRTIYDNILTFVRFQLTTNVAAITTILAAGIIGLPSPFTALQILFVNLIADGPPAMALGVDRARQDVMRRRPRDTDRAILDFRVLASLLPIAVIMAIATLVVLTTTDESNQVTMAFTTFVLLQLGNVLAVRGGAAGVFGRHMFTNRWLWGAVGLVIAVQIAVVHTGVGQSLFDTTALSLQQWAVATGLGTLPIVATEVAIRTRGRAPAGTPGRTSDADR
ncbi:MAG: cation transporting ATPase C-terminal domain-containing protein, partial [Nitriliruptorales bacterium]|nr:cation transporting ATPase C-terminal domain-containing protein [Nitriliruptorales bacterium]